MSRVHYQYSKAALAMADIYKRRIADLEKDLKAEQERKKPVTITLHLRWPDWRRPFRALRAHLPFRHA